MKYLSLLTFGISCVVLCQSCDLLKKDDPTVLGGDQSPMGNVGVTVTSSTVAVAGAGNFSASVTSLSGGVSNYTAQATVTNTLLKNQLTNYPGITVNGNIVSISNLQIESTTNGIRCVSGPGAGILVRYDSSVGDTYPIGSTGKVRTVVSNTGVDDYPYGMFLIKTIQVESDPSILKSTSAGVTKITYIANHKFGLVGVKVAFDDGTSATFPVYTSTQN
jgi:hypothetical protein